jgi:hypothetical protein
MLVCIRKFFNSGPKIPTTSVYKICCLHHILGNQFKEGNASLVLSGQERKNLDFEQID